MKLEEGWGWWHILARVCFSGNCGVGTTGGAGSNHLVSTGV